MFAVVSIVVLFTVQQDILIRLKQTGVIAQTIFVRKTPDGDRELYDMAINFVSNAKSSLRMVSLYRSEDAEASQNRIKYYKVLDEVLDYHHKRDSQFTYERILQVDKVTPQVLSSHQVDSLTFEHCKHVLSLENNRTSLNLHLHQIPVVLGSLNFVVFDNRHVMFNLPVPRRNEHGEIEASHLGASIFFTDHEGSLVKEILQLFSDLQKISTSSVVVTTEENKGNTI